MPHSRDIALFTNLLDAEQRAQLGRALAQFHAAQDIIRLTNQGERQVRVLGGRVSWEHLEAEPRVAPMETVVTGLGLIDNWFSHTRRGRALLTLADWQVAFWFDNGSAPPAAPDANILTSLAITSLLLLAGADDYSVLHERTIGCLFDLCASKPDRAIKMRAAYVCQRCTDFASACGVSQVELDAIHAILERVRSLALGRVPQARLPDATADDDEFIRSVDLPDGTTIPNRLREACREGKLTAIVGSGMSLQSDVRVSYPAKLSWKALPAWSELSMRLSEALARYCDKQATPRQTDTLAEFLADLDYFRTALGERSYYRRAIFDIFTPHILSPGRANRLTFRLPLRWLLTTNYDFVLNYAAPPGTPVFTWRESRQAREYLEGGRALPPLLKLHGCASRPDTVVLTRSEYQELRQSEEYVSLLRTVFESQVLLFLGYGLSDPFDLDLALQKADLAGAAQGEKFALLPRERLEPIKEKFQGIHLVPYSRHEDIPAILAVLCREARASDPNSGDAAHTQEGARG